MQNLRLAEQDLLNVVDEVAQLYFVAIEKNCLALGSVRACYFKYFS